MHILSKSTYIKGLQCEKALYMQKKHPYLRDKLSIEQRARFQRGTDVGVLAHEVFPGGIDMSPNSPSQFPKKAQETMENLSNPEVNVMYEAVFQHNDTLIMLDILVRDGDRWLAVEVKSSLRLSDTYYNDAALQYYVLHGCGVPLSDFRLMYLNGDYVKDGPIDVKQLFKTESVMNYVVEREAFVAQNAVPRIVPIALNPDLIPALIAALWMSFVRAAVGNLAASDRNACMRSVVEQHVSRLDSVTGRKAALIGNVHKPACDKCSAHVACVAGPGLPDRNTGLFIGFDHEAAAVVVRPPAGSLGVSVRVVVCCCDGPRHRFINNCHLLPSNR